MRKLRLYYKLTVLIGIAVVGILVIKSYRMGHLLKRPLLSHDHTQTDLEAGNKSTSASADTVITISPWYKRYLTDPLEHWYREGYGDALFKQCKQPKCRLISNVKDSDVVLISHKFLGSYRDTYHPPLPVRANPQQKWVFYSTEAPQHYDVDVKYANLFNVTYTYRKSSHVFHPFGKLLPRSKPEKLKSANINWSRKANIAWLVSHCQTSGGSLREVYVSELSKWIDVTIYGACGTQRCPRKSTWECYDYLQDSYKFYLAFENSLCKDYVTEKLFFALEVDMIPIVYGLYDYKDNLPETSFIDVRDFSSPRALADYLRILSGNRTLYETYFKWKQYFRVQQYLIHTSACELCDYLYVTRNQAPSTVDLAEFWGEESTCVSAIPVLRAAGISNTTIQEHGLL